MSAGSICNADGQDGAGYFIIEDDANAACRREFNLKGPVYTSLNVS
jgi:hypothetical protein